MSACLVLYMRSFTHYTSKTYIASSVDPFALLNIKASDSGESFIKEKETYLCFTVVTVSAATLVVMFFAATSKPDHMVAKPGQIHKIKKHFSTPLSEYKA